MTTQVFIDAKKACFVAFPAFSDSLTVRRVATSVFPGAKKAFPKATTVFSEARKIFLKS